MYRLLCICCVLTLSWGLESVYAQESASVPVTIILEGPETVPLALVVPFTELTVQRGENVSIEVSLSSAPTGPVTVVGTITAQSSKGKMNALNLNLESLSFTPEDYGVKRMTMTVASDAEEGNYIITLTPRGGGVEESKAIAVSVKKKSSSANAVLEVTPPQLKTVPDARNSILVSLNSPPEGPVNVSFSVTPLSSGRSEGDITFSERSLSFDVDDHGQKRVVLTTASAAEGEYIITLTPRGGGVTESKTVSVEVSIVPGLSPLPTLTVHAGESSGGSVNVTGPPIEEGEVILVELSIFEDVDFLRVNPDRLEFTATNHDEAQRFTLEAEEEAIPDDYTLVITMSEAGVYRYTRETMIELLPCRFLYAKFSDLNFGALSKPENIEEGHLTVTINEEGELDVSGNMNRDDSNQTLGNIRLFSPCELICFSQTRSDRRLTGANDSDKQIDFDMIAIANGEVRNSPIRGESRDLLDASPIYWIIYEFGGKISGITSAKQGDDYRGTIRFDVSCFRG